MKNNNSLTFVYKKAREQFVIFIFDMINVGPDNKQCFVKTNAQV